MSNDEPSIEITRERLVYSNAYGQLFDDDVRFSPSGDEGRYLRWMWRAPYSVAVLPIVDGHYACLIRNFRHSARREVLEAPKGFGAVDRAPSSVACDELLEEAGLIPGELEPLGPLTVDPAFSYYPLHLFIAHQCRVGTPHPEASETILGTSLVNLADVPDLLRSQRVTDAATLVLLWHAYHWLR